MPEGSVRPPRQPRATRRHRRPAGGRSASPGPRRGRSGRRGHRHRRLDAVGAAAQHHRPELRRSSGRLGQVAKPVGRQAVASGHHHPVDRRRRQCPPPRPAARGCGPARATRSAARWRSSRRSTASGTCSGSVRSSAAASASSPSRARMRSKALAPVTASIRRVLEPMDASDTTVMGPIIPRAPTWVPPQSSMEWAPARTTRTRSPYLSPKKARAPMAFRLAPWWSPPR